MNRADRRRHAKQRKGEAPSLAQVQALLAQGRQAEAQRLLVRLLQAQPGNAAAWQLAGLLALRNGEAERAVEALSRADALVPGDPGLRCNLAAALGEAERPAEALSLLDGVLTEDPRHAAAHYNRAVLLRRAAAGEEALAALGRALEAQPDYGKAKAERAHLLLELERYAAALDAYAALGDCLGQARALQGLGRYGEAAAAYAESGDLAPETLLEQARCLQESGNLEGALELYRGLVAKDGKTYAAVAKALTSASRGMLYLNPSKLARLLREHG